MKPFNRLSIIAMSLFAILVAVYAFSPRDRLAPKPWRESLDAFLRLTDVTDTGATPASNTGRDQDWDREGISIAPQTITQGDPLKVSVELGVDQRIKTGTITYASGKKFPLTFSQPTLPSATSSVSYTSPSLAFHGIDIKAPTGTSTVIVTLADGTRREKDFFINPRPRLVENLPVPDQVGGNSPENQERILTLVDQENKELSSIPSDMTRQFWSAAFIEPIRGDVFITDPYGYIRDSGQNLLTHKGADYRAQTGTALYAMNSGIVRIAKNYTIYGGTVVIDHGMGLHTIYMHLSDIQVNNGDRVDQGTMIGLSGATGYASGPHLHLSIKINGVSIDPLTFLKIAGNPHN